ncbi:hypothetical protein [Parabacteroides pacaensis]|uniref:hypothetical protein n=1 Tax=Parabacteroides pacaensis TaxID=2086575 RepID=UPI000D0FFD5A|nr:hypothetical protein [Parabacteroides pacaensis]
MKKILLLPAITFCIFFTSCMPTAKFSTSSSFVDYTKYTTKGFFISEANSVSFEYDAIGSISTLVLSGTENKQNKKNNNAKNVSYGDGLLTTHKIIYATQQDVVDGLYNEAVKQGANGIINLKIEPYFNTLTKREGLQGSAMAIKRK